MATRTNRFLWSVGLGLAYQALIMITGLWLKRFLLLRVGQDTLGVWTMVLQAMNYLTLFDLGLSTLLPREVAETTGRDGEAGSRNLRAIVGRYSWFVIWQTLLLAAVSAVIFAINADHWGNAARPIGWMVAIYVALFPFRLFVGILTGVQDLRFLGFAQMAAYIANVVVCIFLVINGWGLAALVTAWAVQWILVSFAAGSRVLMRYRNIVPALPTPLSFRRTARMFYDGGWTITNMIGVALVNSTDAILIGSIIGKAAVAPYTLTIQLVTVLSPIVLILTPSILPGLSELRGKAAHGRVVTVTTAYTQTVLLLSGWMGSVILATSKGFVTWWFGPIIYLGDSVVWMAVLTINLRHWSNGFAVTLFCCNREKPLWLITLLDGMVSCGMMALIIWIFGPAYIPLGSLVGVAMINLPLTYILIRSELGLTGKQIAANLGWWAVRYALVLAGVFLLRKIWLPAGFMGLAAMSILVSAVYLALMIPRALRAEVGEYLRPRLQPLLSRLRRS